ncbi:glycoside hydrolase family 38 C-terminal domain-containing protein [Floccifex sp.]|uniref:glycoside hydrolase family 38 N-terminal domain-containing protein n=1 Tax=Floccifex sp. TaxID=2815810 RepID=UPI003F0E1262
MAKKANIYHHTHWDNEWYFTEEDSLIQLNYHMKELIEALETGIIDYFFLDGQTAILEDYLELHQEDKERVKKLISSKKLFVGPFLSQIDSFITSGESVINNLRCGMNYANQYGGSSKIAYLPDSFGQSQDYPKIFNECGIHSFVFRRGMGDEHELPLDFMFQSNDGSKVGVTTLNCGYGFATDPFLKKTLTKNAGLDYDGNDIGSQLKKLSDLSTLENDFLLPIGNDQTPVIWNFKDLLKYYQEDGTYDFEETTLEEYMNKILDNEENLKVYQGEFINPQYHRVHRSIGSARMDIKNLQDRVERLMALEVQPIMAILHKMGFEYDQKIINRIWNLLGRSQTHSGATNTDTTNDLILVRTQKAYNLAFSLKIYLMRKIAISLPKENKPIVFFNTLPQTRDLTLEMDVFSETKEFNLVYQKQDVPYTLVSQEKMYGGVIRKNTENYDESKYFYKNHIVCTIPNVQGLSYHLLFVEETQSQHCFIPVSTKHIENDFYRIEKGNKGLNLFIKETQTWIENFIYFEESGDEGDNYDYSYPDHDMINIFHDFNCSFENQKQRQVLTLDGIMHCPKDLESRTNKELNSSDEIHVTITLDAHKPVIQVKGYYDNHSLNHRVRLVCKTPVQTTHSVAGTQFGSILRENNPGIMAKWKKENWLEEPSPIYPLLNYVYLTKENQAMGAITKSGKEYEIIGDGYTDIALTLFRSVGYLGLPDLNRRPGRASGLAERIIPSPESQMICKNEFEFGLFFVKDYDKNEIVNMYNEFVCETCAFQNQSMNRVVYPITYFQTNVMKQEIQEEFILPVKEEFTKMAYSTCEVLKNEVVMRFFNNEKETTVSSIEKLDLFGEAMNQSKEILEGEIVTTKDFIYEK